MEIINRSDQTITLDIGLRIMLGQIPLYNGETHKVVLLARAENSPIPDIEKIEPTRGRLIGKQLIPLVKLGTKESESGYIVFFAEREELEHYGAWNKERLKSVGVQVVLYDSIADNEKIFPSPREIYKPLIGPLTFDTGDSQRQ